MEDVNIEHSITFQELNWDTEFFGVTCAKAIIYNQIKLTEWDNLKAKFQDYQFISIENRNSEPSNARLIGTTTTAFLADVNMQFKKKITTDYEKPKSIQIYRALARDERLFSIADYQYSKFITDPELARRSGAEVYWKWLSNSFEKPDKFFALAEDKDGELIGFVLYSYLDTTCTIELMSVSSTVTKSGIGTTMYRAIEHEACQRGCDNIRVGTQMRNKGAINFYLKNGCSLVECHQVYHLWNL